MKEVDETPSFLTSKIDPGAFVSVFLGLYLGAARVGTATGFIVARGNGFFLVTNYHVLSGRDPDSGKPLHDRPDSVLIAVLRASASGASGWFPCVQKVLSESESTLWVEHPTLGANFDVVALPLDLPADRVLFDWSQPTAPRPVLGLGSELFIAGFPDGVKGAGVTAIWKTGNVATDLLLPVDGRDYFLIDALTRPGMSGAPVIARRSGMYATETTTQMILPDATGVPKTWLLGVYAGRSSDAANMTLGRVWRWSGVETVLEHASGLVQRGELLAQPVTLEHYHRETATIIIHNEAIERGSGAMSTREFISHYLLRDHRLGTSVRTVTLLAELIAAFHPKAGGIFLTPEQYDLLTSRLPSGESWFADRELWALGAKVRQHILDAGKCE